MDAQQFLAEFGHIANAPGGVARLREFVLTLAVSGRLVPQISSEQPAEKWLLNCDQLKSTLAAQKSIPKQAQPEEVRAEDAPFIAPPGWIFARLSSITTKIGSGSTPRGGSQAYAKEGIPFLRSQNVWNDGIRLDDVAYITKDMNNQMAGTIVQAHDLLLNITGASLGRCALVPEGLGPANVSQHVSIIRLVDVAARQYLHLCLQSPLLQSMIWGRQVGMAREGLSKKVLEQFEIPLPPPAEQTRIVAKVDELMALCDQLEQQQQERRKLQNALRQSTLHALASAQSPHELQDSWQRLQANFGRLFSEPEDVRDLRSLVLQLAIRGLLVDQIEAGKASVDEFVASVKAKREELVARGVIRRSMSLPQVEQDEETFALPRGWRFCRLGEVSICRDGQRIPLSKTERAPRQGVYPYYGASGIIDHINDYIFDESLLLVGEDGANLINRSTPIAFIASGHYWVNNHAHVLDSVGLVALKYLEVFINAIDLRPHVTGTAQPKMNQEKMNLIVVAVPPPEEQARIVGRVAELIKVCNTIEEQLRGVIALARRLAIAAVTALTGTTIEQEEESPVKASQTELIAPLRLGTPPDVKAQAPLATLLARHNGELPARDLWQRFGGEIDAFYAQLKTEVARGWIAEPEVAEMREKPTEVAGT